MAVTGLPTLFEEENLQKRRILKVHEEEKSELYKQIGKLTTELEWLKKNLHNSFCDSQIRQLVDFAGEISVSRQAELLGLNRSTLYYKPKFPTEDYLKINRFIDEIYTDYPFFGYRRVAIWLDEHYGVTLDPKTVLKHMQEMGIQAIYPRPNLSKQDRENKVYTYLLKNVAIVRPNQVLSIDITYIPIRSSFLYLTAIIDWYSSYVIAWEIDDTLDIDFVLQTCQNALSVAVPCRKL